MAGKGFNGSGGGKGKKKAEKKEPVHPDEKFKVSAAEKLMFTKAKPASRKATIKAACGKSFKSASKKLVESLSPSQRTERIEKIVGSICVKLYVNENLPPSERQDIVISKSLRPLIDSPKLAKTGIPFKKATLDSYEGKDYMKARLHGSKEFVRLPSDLWNSVAKQRTMLFKIADGISSGVIIVENIEILKNEAGEDLYYIDMARIVWDAPSSISKMDVDDDDDDDEGEGDEEEGEEEGSSGQRGEEEEEEEEEISPAQNDAELTLAPRKRKRATSRTDKVKRVTAPEHAIDAESSQRSDSSEPSKKKKKATEPVKRTEITVDIEDVSSDDEKVWEHAK